MSNHGSTAHIQAGGGRIKSGIVAALVGRAGELGVDCADWFAGMPFAAADVKPESPIYLSYRQACEVVRRALRSLPGSAHGLEIGYRQDVGHFGLVGLAMLTANNFGEALELGIQFAPVTGAMMELRSEPWQAGEQAGIAVAARMRTHDPDIEPFLNEELFASCMMLSRGLLGPDFTLESAEFSYPMPAHADAYPALFGCEVRFNAPANRVRIHRRWLQRPMPAHNPATARHVLALCREQMPAEQPSRQIVGAVEQLLRLQVADAPRLTDIAAELHLTERTLRRHLQEAGTHFKALHDQVRREAAETLLRTPGVPIAEVGASVGFADAREFRRAFKRWTGHSPREARHGKT
ncbi:AraC family transcriptional regulator [Lysobacter sp. SG-8]|uniref:AraC family transcriptional regulator n=1 Tax=Marilutibacter penaei TaxID=2759900 RepID=A0A7W3U3L6_9GAMM|nr:AraC family transcriptional regulator [Lysobacter penaei]MBB1088311.1 AraC family transcriptional regulator [Lysobacter penaei]